MPMTNEQLDRMATLVTAFECAARNDATASMLCLGDPGAIRSIIQRKYEARDALVKFIVEVSNHA